MKKLLIGAAALLLAAPALAQATQAPAASPPAMSAAGPDYADPAIWLCRPGRDDACSKPLPTTALNANGYGSVGQSAVAAAPHADCFYVYPTVSRDPADNSDLIPGIEEQ